MIIPAKQSAEFVANMENVLDVNKRPFSKDYPVVCMDESPKQQIKNTRLPIKMVKGRKKRVDYEYARYGVCNIFIANEPLKGLSMEKITQRKTKKDWAVFIQEIADELYKDAKKITLAMDNLNTHKPRLLYEAFEPKKGKEIWDRFICCYTKTRKLA